MFMGELDTTCPLAQNEITKAEIGDMIKFWKYYKGVDHGGFIMVNTDEYINDLLEFLKPEVTNSTQNYLQ